MIARIALLLFLAFGALTQHAGAQACIGFGSVTPDHDSLWLPADSNITYTIVLKNKGQSAFDGDIILRASYNGSPSYNWGVISQVNIAPGDSITTTFSETIEVTTTIYKGGDNTILVWPLADGAQICDTTATGVYVDGVIGILKPQGNTRVKLFPNPASDVLNLTWNQDKHDLEYVRLVNLAGQQVFFSDHFIGEIQTNTLPRGIYLLEIRYTDGERGIYKITIDK